MKPAQLDLEEAAKKAGNWRHFDYFVWFRQSELSDPDNWAIIYTQNRDSGLLDQSNATVIAKTLEKFTEGDDPDVVFESHSHWAVGHVDGFSIRVFNREGEITDAFEKYHDLAERIEDYPVLDDEDYSNREYEATVRIIEDAAWRLKNEFTLPDGWPGEVYGWLSDHECREIENVDDQGGYPDEDALRRAFKALRYSSQ